MNRPERNLSVRVLAPIAAMQALVRDGVLCGGDTVLIFRRGPGEWYDVDVGPDKHDNYLVANVWLHTNGEYALFVRERPRSHMRWVRSLRRVIPASFWS